MTIVFQEAFKARLQEDSMLANDTKSVNHINIITCKRKDRHPHYHLSALFYCANVWKLWM